MDLTSQQLEQQGHHDGATSADVHPTTTAQESASRLSALTKRLSTFLQGHVERLQDAAREIQSAAELQAKYEAMTLELTQKQQEWEQQKQSESQQLAADARRLSDAWDEIESERRDRLSHGASVSVPCEQPAKPEVVQETQSNQSLADTALFDLGMPKSSQPSTVQFQQLKREIRKHARRHR